MRSPRFTGEEVGLRIIEIIGLHGKFPPLRSGEDESERRRIRVIPTKYMLAEYLGVDMAPYMEDGLRWIDRHPEYGALVIEPHGRLGTFIGLLTDPALVDEYQPTARFNLKYQYSRDSRLTRKLDALRTLMADDPAARTLVNAALSAENRAQAEHRVAVRSLVSVFNMSEDEAESWLVDF